MSFSKAGVYSLLFFRRVPEQFYDFLLGWSISTIESEVEEVTLLLRLNSVSAVSSEVAGEVNDFSPGS